MANVTVPMPIAVAGGALCLLGGFLVGAVAGPDTPSQDTAEVVSYTRDADRLCLTGEAVADSPEAQDGVLCGTWRRDAGATDPAAGDDFRFVLLTSRNTDDGESATFIFGDVVS